jgi:hypothetical protein
MRDVHVWLRIVVATEADEVIACMAGPAKTSHGAGEAPATIRSRSSSSESFSGASSTLGG